MDESLGAADPERTVGFEFVRATENAALNVLPWLGRGEKEKADAAACDAINGVFDPAANAAHDVFKTVPSISVARATTITTNGKTLAVNVLYTDYPVTRAAGGELTYSVPGVLADGAVPTWA